MYLAAGIANFRAANLSLHSSLCRGLASACVCFVDLAQSSINSQAAQAKGASDTCPCWQPWRIGQNSSSGQWAAIKSLIRMRNDVFLWPGRHFAKGAPNPAPDDSQGTRPVQQQQAKCIHRRRRNGSQLRRGIGRVGKRAGARLAGAKNQR